MANHQIVYQFNFTGNINKGLAQLTGSATKATGAVERLSNNLKIFANVGFVITHVSRAFRQLSGVISDAQKAYQMHASPQVAAGSRRCIRKTATAD